MNYSLLTQRKAALILEVRDYFPSGKFSPFRYQESLASFKTYLYPHVIDPISISSFFFSVATDDRKRTSKMNVSLRNRKGQFVSYRTAAEEYGISEQVGIDIAKLPNI